MATVCSARYVSAYVCVCVWVDAWLGVSLWLLSVKHAGGAEMHVYTGAPTHPHAHIHWLQVSHTDKKLLELAGKRRSRLHLHVAVAEGHAQVHLLAAAQVDRRALMKASDGLL